MKFLTSKKQKTNSPKKAFFSNFFVATLIVSIILPSGFVGTMQVASADEGSDSVSQSASDEPDDSSKSADISNEKGPEGLSGEVGQTPRAPEADAPSLEPISPKEAPPAIVDEPVEKGGGGSGSSEPREASAENDTENPQQLQGGGSITVCKMIADQNGNLATSSTGLPQGTFGVRIIPFISPPPFVSTAQFDASHFSPNTRIILGQNDAECTTFDNLPLDPLGYRYEEETVIDPGTYDWMVPEYNDQKSVAVTSVNDFFLYSRELYDNDPSNDGSRNLNSDGQIILTASQPNATVVVLNRYVVTDPGVITVCKMIADQNGIVATSSAGLPAGNFRIQIAETQNFASSTILNPTFNTSTFHPNTKILNSSTDNDAECATFNNLPIQLPSYWYNTEIITGAASTTWLTPLYNDQFNINTDDINDFFLYSHQLFDNDPTNDGNRNENSDGHITLETQRPNRTLIVLNRYTLNALPGSIMICKMIVDQNGNIATSSAGLPAGNFEIDLRTSTSSTATNFGVSTFNTTTFTPNHAIIGPNPDAECDSYHVPWDEYYYTREIVSPANPNNWLEPLYNDQMTIQVTSLNNFFSYSPELFDSNPDNDDSRNLNSDGKIPIETSWNMGTLVVLNRVRQAVNTPPTITLLGDNPLVINLGQPFIDPGATAFDVQDGDLTSAIIATGTVDTNTLGIYTKTYSVTDSEGLTASTTRTVSVTRQISGNFGSISVCKMIVDQNGHIATSSAGLPDGIFDLKIMHPEPVGTSTIIDTTWNASTFAPNAQIILGQNDAQCVTYDHLQVFPGQYLYGTESLAGTTTNSWATPLYNDQFDNNPLSLSDFFAYQANGNSDGIITLETNRPNRTLIVLNTYQTPIQNTPPHIDLIGDNPFTVTTGDPFNDPGAGAFDAEDGDLTSSIVVTGTVDTNTVGSYSRTYSVSDSGGLSDSVTRTINVVDGGGGGGGGGGGHHRQKVLGASVEPQECFYLHDFLRRDWNNSRFEVLKLQYFLINLEGFSNLKATGVFDKATFNAVSQFQLRYFDDILKPWGHTTSTGFVYILTKKKVNEIVCQKAFPVTSLEAQEISNFKALLESLKRAGIPVKDILPVVENPSVENSVENVDDTGIIGLISSTSTINLPNIADLDKGQTVANRIRSLAGAIFSVPSNPDELLQSLYFLLIALIAIYLLTEIILGSIDTKKLSDGNIRFRKYVLYIIGLILAIVVAIWYDIFNIVVPLVILAIVSAVLLAWNTTKPAQSSVINLPAPAGGPPRVKWPQK